VYQGIIVHLLTVVLTFCIDVH